MRKRRITTTAINKDCVAIEVAKIETVPVRATVPSRTCVTVTQVTLAAMSSVELDSFIKDRAIRCSKHIEGLKQRATELYMALHELEERYNKQQGARSDLHELPAATWHEYIESCGVNPATYRKWKSRNNEALKQLGTLVDPTSSSGGGNGSSAGPAEKWNIRTQKQAAKCLEAGSRIVAAIEAGQPVTPLVGQWKSVAFTPNVTDALLAKVDPVGEFIQSVVTPYAVSILRYVRALEDVVFFHASEVREDRENRLYEFKQGYLDVPMELMEVFNIARKAINSAKEATDEPDPLDAMHVAGDVCPKCGETYIRRDDNHTNATDHAFIVYIHEEHTVDSGTIIDKSCWHYIGDDWRSTPKPAKRKRKANSADKLTGEPEGTPLGGGVRAPESAPSSV